MPKLQAFLILATALPLLTCGNNRSSTPPMCPASCVSCDDQMQCHDCDATKPTLCESDLVYVCNADGSKGSLIKTCDSDSNEHCMNGNCLSPCDVAAASRSYIGCDYWPTPLLNAQLNGRFDFAVVVANPLKVNDVTTPAPAKVKVVYGSAPCVPDENIDDTVVQKTTVEPGQFRVIPLPWIDGVSQIGQREYSSQTTDGAYHLCSSLPVSAYQFNPLEFNKPASQGQQCPVINGQLDCHSYSNDASTLFPTSTLGKEYIVAARGTMALQQHRVTFPPMPDPPPSLTPGFFTVVGTEDDTTVTVQYSSYTEAGVNLDPQSPGATATYTIGRGEVLEIISGRPAWKPNPNNPKAPPCVDGSMDNQGIYCDLGKDYDLTGSHITSDKPIAAFGGHSCSFVPFGTWACDHLEQQLFPLITWGQKYLAAQTPAYAAMTHEPNLFRVISGSADNTITFDGPMPTKELKLGMGEWVEFAVNGGFQATSTGRLMIAQYMVGENFTSEFVFDAVGDPALGLVVPLEQYRKSYDFLTPDTYTNQFVTVIAQQGSIFVLDDLVKMMPFDQEIGSSGYSYLHVPLMSKAHHISSEKPFGITVSGTAAFTSYLFPGGLNLNELSPPQ